MSYIVKTSFYEGNILHEEGAVFEHTDADLVKKCLEDGNIANASDEEVAVLAEKARAEQEENDRIHATDTAHHESMHASQNAEQVADPLSPASVNVESQLPEAPVNQVPTEGVQPTPEDIQKTLSESGLGESSENLVN